jgi:hypothetical protein
MVRRPYPVTMADLLFAALGEAGRPASDARAARDVTAAL